MRIIKLKRTALKGLNIKKDVNDAKREHREQERSLKNYVKVIPGLVEKVYQSGKKIYEEVVTLIPGRNVDSVLRQRRKAWMQRAAEIEGMDEFYTYISGEDNKQKVLRIVCDIVSGQMLLRDGKKRLITWASNFFKNTETEEKKSTFQDSGYDEALLEILPPQVYFELGPNRELLTIKESFGREQKNWEVMSKKIAYIAQHFNVMAQDIKKDLNSGDEVTKLLALMMAITIETGLRPGGIGNTAKIIDPITGEKIEIDTFGVTTLQVQHVKNIRDGFVELQFPGKKGTEQIAKLTDNDIINALQQILATTSLQGDATMLFITKSGQHVDDSQMRDYVKDKWRDITPTDFRKFVATKNFYNYIKQQTDAFRTQLMEEITKGQEVLKETIVNGVIKMISDAAYSTRQVLNHKEGNDAWKSYISPKVILAYLSNGGLNDTLEDILIDNKNVRFYFGGCLENYTSVSEIEITTAEYFFIEFIN
jgi:DNA topoisomerase IB